MFSKKIILSVVFVLALSGAMAGYHWWKVSGDRPVPEKTMPSAAEEFGKVMQAYGRADSLSEVSGTIRIYDKEDKGSLKETKTFCFVRSGAGYYARMSYLQTYCDGVWMVQLDTVHHRVQVSGAPSGVGGMLPGPLTTLFSDTARFRIGGVVTDEGGERGLHLQNEFRPEIRSSTLFYDTLSYRLNRAEVEWWKPSSLPNEKGDRIWLAKIDYRYRPAPRLDLSEKVRSILTVTGGGVKLTATYRDYEVNPGNK